MWRLVRSGDGEPVAKTGVEAMASLAADSEASGVDKMQGSKGPFIPVWPEDGWDSKDGSTGARGNGTARCCVEAEHALALQTAARVPVALGSREGYTKRTMSVRLYPG
jgi:hypothetical protein